MLLSIDFGGTRTKIGLVSNYKVLDSWIIPSRSNESYKTWVKSMHTEILSHIENAGYDWNQVQSMAWAVPLVVSPCNKKATQHFGKFSDITDPEFVPYCEQLFGKPLMLENDARAATIGEFAAGSGQGKLDMAMITLGTGIGTGVIINGVPLRGKSGRAGNMDGNSIMYANLFDEEDENSARLENQVATWAIPELIRNHPDFSNSQLSSVELLDYKNIFELSESGDALAIHFRDKAIRAWACLAINMVNQYDLDCIIFGGGILKSQHIFIPRVQEIIFKRLNREISILASCLEENAALIGNAYLWSSEKN